MNATILSILRRWIAIGLSFVLAIALAGCNPQNYRTEAAQVSQVVTAITADPKTFNLVLSKESPNVFGPIYEGMLTENGVTGELSPGLAERWEEDGQRIIFTLREGLKWSDGQPLTTDDVLFTFNELYFSTEIPTSYRDILQIGESKALPQLRKIDDRRIEVTSPEPFAPLLRTVGGVSILPKHALQQAANTKDRNGNLIFLSTWGTDTDPAKIVSNGPYKLESYVPSERVTFRRNPYHWRQDAQGNPQPYIERMIWQIVESPDTSLIQFRSKGLDVLEVAARNFSLLKREETRGAFNIYNGGPDTGSIYIAFNQNKGRRDGKPLIDPVKSRWFNTVEFRQAISHAINRPAMLNIALRGIGELQHSTIWVKSPFYLSPEQGLKVYDYNLDKARELLQKAGFKYNNQGQLLDADGNRVRFTLLGSAGSRTGEIVGSQMKLDLSKIGIQMDFQLIDFSVLGNKIFNTFDWEAIFGATSGGGLDPNGSANFWSPDGEFHPWNQKPTAGQTPLEGREVPAWEAEIGRLYIEGAQELDEEKRKEYYFEAQRIAAEHLPLIHLFTPTSLTAVRDRIQGVQYSAYGGALWNIYELRTVD
ncbi:ABC transporter substrate-binding protein [Gloeocapsopsis dulcis]|uniref:Peptide ABC transporter substrate-binding protein n=1 Tax=Gloeocapsopsis dulcis AAB1 = 1H9 TaxID=1433147 RepID=A0A6N8FUH8_9CHRO|nr:ABC transporter substrate-binding protein [Gloeocapsopsis dulcis]MUL35596.1 peptide ABC transporter substrate-binding protein [Gloeocapsopsis dulcis AAB1 = 1H9]WNN87501.1 ABC transporter substrate-binding protein [Gloeocapsopsis dulcis]